MTQQKESVIKFFLVLGYALAVFVSTAGVVFLMVSHVFEVPPLTGLQGVIILVLMFISLMTVSPVLMLIWASLIMFIVRLTGVSRQEAITFSQRMDRQANKAYSDASYNQTAAVMSELSDKSWFVRLQVKSRMWVMNIAYWGKE